MKKILGLLMVMGLMVSVGDVSGEDSPTGPSEKVAEGPQGQTLNPLFPILNLKNAFQRCHKIVTSGGVF